jgi:hypothetical protein
MIPTAVKYASVEAMTRRNNGVTSLGLVRVRLIRATRVLPSSSSGSRVVDSTNAPPDRSQKLN